MKTIDQLLEKLIIKAEMHGSAGKDHEQEVVLLCNVKEVIKEYAKQESIAFLDDLRQYWIDLEGKDPFDLEMNSEEYYEIYKEVEE